MLLYLPTINFLCIIISITKKNYTSTDMSASDPSLPSKNNVPQYFILISCDKIIIFGNNVIVTFKSFILAREVLFLDGEKPTNSPIFP